MASTAAEAGGTTGVMPPYAPWHPPGAQVDLSESRTSEATSQASGHDFWDRAAMLARTGYAARAAGDLDRAATTLRAALSLFGSAGDRRSAMPVYAALAELRFAEGDYPAAAAVQREALALLPGDTRALIGLAYAEWYEGNFADALTLFGEAIAVAPDQTTARQARGQLLADLGRPSAALADLDGERAIDDPDIRSALGLALDALDRVAEADREIGAALALEPDRPRTHLRMARIALRRGDQAEARGHLQRALDGDPALPPAHAAQTTRLLNRLQSSD